MQKICLILARKNSRRIKGKNMILFNGKPLIYWTILIAYKSNIFDRIILSSDWAELKKFAKFNFKDLEIDNRPKKLSKSNTTSEKVIKYLFKKYKIIKGYSVLLQPTSPIRNILYLKRMVRLLIAKKLNTLQSVSQIKNKTSINYKKNTIYNFPKKVKNKSLFLNGSIYIFRNSFFFKTFSLKEKKGNYFFHEKKFSLDLDDINDLKLFRAKYYFNNKKKLIVNTK